MTTDFNHNPVAIDHYEVYARSTLFTMANVRDGLVPMINSTTSVSIEISPPAGPQYYSVVSVDLKGNKSPF